MKKLVLFFAVVAAVSFAACGNKSEGEGAATDSVAVAPVEVAAPVAVDTVAAAVDTVAATAVK